MGSPRKIESVLDIRYGQDPDFDAWLLHIMSENHIEYATDPDKNASPEQVRFMVALEDDQVYVPCSDWMFRQLSAQELTSGLLSEYVKKWRRIAGLVVESIQDRYLRTKVLSLCRRRFRLYLSSSILIPSRLQKQMSTIVMALSGLDDPYRERKRENNRRAMEMIETPEFEALVNSCPGQILECPRIDELRSELDRLELSRLIRAATMADIRRGRPSRSDMEMIRRETETGQQGEGEESDPQALLFHQALLDAQKILYLPDYSGGLMFDALVIMSLLRMGKRVMLSLKEGFYFEAPTFWDVERDPFMARALKSAHFLQDDRVSKNDLLSALREHRFLVISDGTRERLNLYRTSVTFARAWKEADLVLAKGEANYYRLIQTSHSFTRDVASFFRGQGGGFHLHFKPKAQWAARFSEEALLAKAAAIVSEMRGARMAGRTVMFYSGIIGSIPGQTKEAIEVMNVFVGHLRSRLEGAYILNPAEQFERGMDADDLMFMWERVQRSGLITVWRFQTVQDIEKSFELMGRKVPPAWAGKDATYSTGCTKEMKTALDMQQRQPELQIIGPSPEKFFRRREYGVGRFCDAAIDVC